MPVPTGKEITALGALLGANLASGDAFVVADVSANQSKKILANQLAIALIALLASDSIPVAKLSGLTEAVQDVIGALSGFGGSGLTFAYDDSGNAVSLAINVDGATIEVNADTLRVKSDSIGPAQLAAMATETVAGTTYSVVVADALKDKHFTNAGAITVTLPKDATENVAVGDFVFLTAIGAGQITCVAESGATLLAVPTAKSAAQGATIVGRKIAANTWQMLGQLASS